MTGSHNKAPRRMNKSFWFAVHGWLTLPIWGLLLLISVTGTLCVVSQEITWLASPHVRADNPEGASLRSFDSLASAVTQAHPGAQIQSVQMNAPYLAHLVRVSLPTGGRKILHVNQYTGRIQGETQGVSLRGFMLALHGWLMFPWQDDYNIGWYIVTAVSIPLLASLITGLILVKRFWRVFYQPRLRFDKGARVFWGDAHRLIGVWSMWFVLIISASGFWFLIEGVMGQNDVVTYPSIPVLTRESVPVTADGAAPDLVSLDRAVAAAREVYPDLRVKSVTMPEHAYGPLSVSGARGISLLRENTNVVHFNPYSGDIVDVRGSGDLSAVQFASALLMPLHFGDFGGLIVKGIWFLFGCLLSLMICSGLVIWSKRTVNATQVLRQRSSSTSITFTGESHGRPQVYGQ